MRRNINYNGLSSQNVKDSGNQPGNSVNASRIDNVPTRPVPVPRVAPDQGATPTPRQAPVQEPMPMPRQEPVQEPMPMPRQEPVQEPMPMPRQEPVPVTPVQPTPPETGLPQRELDTYMPPEEQMPEYSPNNGRVPDCYRNGSNRSISMPYIPNGSPCYPNNRNQMPCRNNRCMSPYAPAQSQNPYEPKYGPVYTRNKSSIYLPDNAIMPNRGPMSDEDFKYMKSLYPIYCKRIQAIIDEECDRIDYDGSYMYDEYPDKEAVESLTDRICMRLEEEENYRLEDMGLSDSVEANQYGRNPWIRDLTKVLLLNEIFRRRSRRYPQRFPYNQRYPQYYRYYNVPYEYYYYFY